MRRLSLFALAAAAWAGDAPNLARVDPPAADVSVEEAVKAGAAWLVEHQNEDGSWGTRTTGRWYEIRADVPGGHYAFQAATTALCYMALLAVESGDEARDKALGWLIDHVRVKRAEPAELYNTWSFGFGLQALSRALTAGEAEGREEAVRATARELVKALGVYQTPDGGWGYYDFQTRAYKPSWSTSFSTATVAVALHEARRAGIEVPDAMVEKAVRNLKACRKPDGSYLYGTYLKYSPLHGVNQPQGSAMRTQACNLALHLFGELDEKALREGLDQLERHQRFAIAGLRRPIPHESWYFVSGYFYLYGHFYGGAVAAKIGSERHRPVLEKGVLKARQPDGSFWDYPLYGYHKSYGTAFALLALRP